MSPKKLSTSIMKREDVAGLITAYRIMGIKLNNVTLYEGFE